MVKDAQHALGARRLDGVVERGEQVLQQERHAEYDGAGELEPAAVRCREHDEQHEAGYGEPRPHAVRYGVGNLLARCVLARAAPLGPGGPATAAGRRVVGRGRALLARLAGDGTCVRGLGRFALRLRATHGVHLSSGL